MSHSSSLSKSFSNLTAQRLTSGSISLGKALATQLTSVTTSVSINASAGKITTFSATAAANGGSHTFTVNNPKVSASSVVVASVSSYAGTGIPVVQVGSVGSGSFTLKVINVDSHDGTNPGDALNAPVQISFIVM